MAKKGGPQKLQEEITNDEEMDKFMERPGLLVLDVYSEWCGPCLGMVGSLRKIKMEIGGDNLQLATCKSDSITYLNRFCLKSEPTWLFVANKRAVNIMFGSDVPKLIQLITRELDLLTTKTFRPTYDITELLPIEVEQLRIKTEAIEKAKRIEREAKEKKRTDYLRNVTNIIMENMPDIGITVFGPQVNRDMFKKISEPADLLKMQCKDRRVIEVTLEDFETVNFACKNPLSQDVLEQFHEKELLICFWKVDESVGKMTDVLMTYVHDLTKETVIPIDDFNFEEIINPPILSPMKVKVEIEIEEGEVWIDEDSSDLKIKHGRSTVLVPTTDDGIEVGMDEFDGEEEGEEEEGEGDQTTGVAPEMPFDFDLDIDNPESGEEEEEVVVIEEPKKHTRIKTVKLPPVWTPIDRRTHATLIYVFFRGQTTGFLPPDPKPEPPHVIMAFDAHKRKDLINVINRNKDDIPLFGYFSSDDPENTKLVANTNEKYAEEPRQATDKIILKVNKVRSNTMLALVSYGPTYVSPNIDVGREEALKFFPENYKSAADEDAEKASEQKSKKRKKSKKDAEDGRESAAPKEVTEVQPTPEGGIVPEDVKEPAKVPPEDAAAADGGAVAEGTATGEGAAAAEVGAGAPAAGEPTVAEGAAVVEEALAPTAITEEEPKATVPPTEAEATTIPPETPPPPQEETPAVTEAPTTVEEPAE